MKRKLFSFVLALSLSLSPRYRGWCSGTNDGEEKCSR